MHRTVMMITAPVHTVTHIGYAKILVHLKNFFPVHKTLLNYLFVSSIVNSVNELPIKFSILNYTRSRRWMQDIFLLIVL